MAVLKLYKIEFLEDDGSFITGDILEIFVDDTLVSSTGSVQTVGITVQKNGVSFTDNTSYFSTLTAPNIVLFKAFGLGFCSGTSLISFKISSTYPFAYYDALQNHNSCTIDAPTCDLILSETPIIVNASDEETADGSITINATSTNTIEYKLNEDFVYGSGQSSSTFSGLLPGFYRVFLRDSKNCGLNVQVEIPFDVDYGTVYRLEYDDIAGVATQINIQKRGFSGTLTEVDGGDSPFTLSLRGEGVTDKFDPIISSQGDLTLISDTIGKYLELYTNDRNLYRVEYKKGGTTKWTGKVLPFIYQEPVQAAPYPTQIIASDGLPELKDFYFIQDDGQVFTGTMSLIKLVAYILKKVKLDLNICVGINMYAEGMDTTNADDPFDQAYVDLETFYLAEDEPSLDFVLRTIIEPFNARLIQWENKWWIVKIEELSGGFDYREFDSDGDYLSNSSYQPIKEINYPDQEGLMFESFPNLELKPGYGEVRVNYKMGLKTNILRNGDFRLRATFNTSLNEYEFDVNTDGFIWNDSGYPTSLTYEEIEEGNIALKITKFGDIVDQNTRGQSYLQSDVYSLKMGTNNQVKISLTCKLTGGRRAVPVPYYKVRLRVKYGSLYLLNDGSWSSTENTLDFISTTYNEYQELSVTAEQPDSGTPVSGMDFDVRVYDADQFFTQFQSLTSLRAFDTYNSGIGTNIIETGYKTELRDDFTDGFNMYFYELKENTDAESGYSIVRPDDYHAVDNPRQWILVDQVPVNSGRLNNEFLIDVVKVNFLTDGKDPIDTIVSKENCEPENTIVYEKELFLGSYSPLIVTQTRLLYVRGSYITQTQTINILPADLIYTGWLRDASGVGWVNWTRAGYNESAKMHNIWLKSYAEQYKRSWRLLRARIVSLTDSFGFLNTIKDVNDSDRLYLPVSLTIDDKRNSFDGEFLEFGLSGSAGLDGSTEDESAEVGFTTGFTIGYNA